MEKDVVSQYRKQMLGIFGGGILTVLSALLSVYFGSIFLAFSSVPIFWWFIPVSFGYSPFFIKELSYKPHLLMMIQNTVIPFWYLLMLFLGFVDVWFGFTRFLLAQFYTGSTTLVAWVLPIAPASLKIAYDRFFSRVHVQVLEKLRRGISMPSEVLSFDNFEAMKQGLPVLVENKKRTAISLSFIFFEATIIDVPISFLRRGYGCNGFFREEYALPNIELIEKNSSRLLFIPWDFMEKSSLRA
jgi:hypothetical protein